MNWWVYLWFLTKSSTQKYKIYAITRKAVIVNQSERTGNKTVKGVNKTTHTFLAWVESEIISESNTKPCQIVANFKDNIRMSQFKSWGRLQLKNNKSQVASRVVSWIKSLNKS